MKPRVHARIAHWSLGVLAVGAGALLAGVPAAAQQPLRPELAYPFTVEADTEQLVVRFDIEDGYYLYRSRFDFGSATDGVELGAPRYPTGETHSDEFFGEQEIYRGAVDISIPYTRSPGAESLELAIGLQGCADIGLCYPPQNWTREVALPARVAGATPFSVPAPDANAPALLGGASGELLPADQAFVMNARFDRANELTIGWQIAPGYYLYRDKLEIDATGDIELGAVSLPDGEAHHDDNFGDVRVFYDYVEAKIPFSRASPEALPVDVRAVFQGCKEDSICYPPTEQTMSLVLPAAAEFSAGDAAAVLGGDEIVSEQDRLASVVLGGSWPLVLGTFYGLGLLLAFTPCVLPMVPILSGIIAGHGQISTGRAFGLSFTYVMGMAVTYTVAGALAALAGEQIQAIFQKPWIISIFAGLFVLLALSMFGVFQLQMPAAIQTRMAALANRQKAGTFVGTGAMGALSALIVTTCVAPPLVATLAVIGQNGDVARGAGALFALSLGMGSPLLVVGTSAGKLLPKVGAWMNTVKAAFGVMMLGLAIWMMERVLPGNVVLVLWALLVFLTGVFLGAFEPLPASPTATKRLSKGLGVLACLYGALMLIGATLGGEDPLRPIPRGAAVPAGAVASPDAALAFQPVDSVADLETALGAAREAGRPVMIDFTAEWCVSCKEMEKYTFPDAGVVAALEPFVLLRADVTANDDDDKALLKYFDSFGPPTIAFFDSAGQLRDAYKLVGFVPPEDFAVHVGRVAAL